jgi:hypothetical protein
MTDQDEPRESFLERWSRKKAQRDATDVVPPARDEAPEKRSEPAPAATARNFDISSLPSLDSITSVTDVRAFLAAEVPQELTRAALRRVWATDPTIRDFVGLQENDWDFTKPEGVPGFGPLPADVDIKKLLTQIFGEADKEPDGALSRDATMGADEQQALSATHESPHTDTPITPPPADEQPQRLPYDDQPAIVRRNSTAASQDDPSQIEPHVETAAIPAHRRHGGALPKV